VHDETLPVVLMRISNPYYSPFASHCSNAAPTPSGFAQIVSDDFPVVFHSKTSVLTNCRGSTPLFLAEFLESGIAAQRIPDQIEP